MLPRVTPELETAAVHLLSEARALAAALCPGTKRAVTDLVRTMNCRSSNFLEGHDTKLVEIEAALQKDYSSDPTRRNLQKEALAHIEVQTKIDHGLGPRTPTTDATYLLWLHREFMSGVPEDLRTVRSEAGRVAHVEPGVLRTLPVTVGRHLAPEPARLPAFLERFAEAYDSSALEGPIRKLVGVAAAHHRLLWIHPFLDGNGRVARFLSHATLLRLEVCDGLWSVSRGLARNAADYKERLAGADGPRRGDLDGRGALTDEGLRAFCGFFLEACLDQVRFMANRLDLANLLPRMVVLVREEIEAGRLHKRSERLMAEVIRAGEVEKSRVAEVLGVSERTARSVATELVAKELLTSESVRAPYRLVLKTRYLDRLVPGLDV